MLARFTQIDYSREMGLISVVHDVEQREKQIGVARYSINPDGRSCEFAIVVADEWQRQGIAHLLMQQLLAAARSHGLQLMEGDVLSTNNDMLTLAAKLGFNISTSGEDPDVVHVVLRL
jgi:acetyltransferase